MGGNHHNSHSRGALWVLVQVPVLGVAFFLPLQVGWGLDAGPFLMAVAFGLVLCGLGLALFAALQLGHSLTPFPVPKPNTTLQVRGLYRFMRHPIYTGAVVACVGWSLWWGSWPGMLWVVVVFAFFDRKATYEERWLVARFPQYQQYQKRTAKFFPFVY